MNRKIKILLLGCFIVFMQSCMNDDVLRDFERLSENRNGKSVFIVNEGNFMYGNASLSYYNPDDSTVINNIFYNTNALPLGDVAYSMTVNDSLGYVVVNNSGKIYVINIHTFKYVGKITGLVSPRYISFVSDIKAYVTDLYSRSITIVNPATLKITGHISLDNGNQHYNQHPSEQIVKYGDKVFVNCWSYDNKVLVIDINADKVIDSLTVAMQPNSMVLDKNGKLWVLSDGGSQGSPLGQDTAALTKIDAATVKVEKTFLFNDINASPSNLAINGSGDTLWFIYNSWDGAPVDNAGLFVMSVSAEKLPAEPFIPQNGKLFYSLGIDPVNSDIYISDAVDFTSPGKVYRFSVSGIPRDTLTVGIIPGDFCFVK